MPEIHETVTVTVEQVEAALRNYLAILDYDLHKNLECGEETGEDTYADEAADLYGHLISASTPATVVYELRTGADDDSRPDVVARYATALAAMEHGEAQYRAKHGTTDHLEWPSTGADTAPRWRLETVDDLDGDETLTDWHIVAVTIPATYTPTGGESR